MHVVGRGKRHERKRRQQGGNIKKRKKGTETRNWSTRRKTQEERTGSEGVHEKERVRMMRITPEIVM